MKNYIKQHHLSIISILIGLISLYSLYGLIGLNISNSIKYIWERIPKESQYERLDREIKQKQSDSVEYYVKFYEMIENRKLGTKLLDTEEVDIIFNLISGCVYILSIKNVDSEFFECNDMVEIIHDNLISFNKELNRKKIMQELDRLAVTVINHKEKEKSIWSIW